MINRSILLAALGAPSLLLGGCMGTENRGLESIHQPVVSRAAYALDLGTAGGALASGEAQRLNGWLGAMNLGWGDRVAIDDPAGDGLAAHEQVAGVVAGYGLLLADEAPVSNGSITPGTIRVVVSRMRADVPGCPDWSRDEAHEFNSNTSSNQGCAVNGTLAAMIANPGDLVRGQPGGTTNDSRISYRAIDAFRKAAPTGGGGTTAGSGGGK